MRKITLDTGPISLYLAKNIPKNIERLFQSIEEKKIHAYVITPVLAEVFKHLCIQNGKSYAESVIISFLQKRIVQISGVNQNTAIKAGELKCKHRKILSYNDCFVLAFSLLNSYEVHTTEKDLPTIHKLKVITYDF